MNTAHSYRADIDGLRAVAVFAVVIYHLGVSFVPGGFVGVDVFFVISGFLITSIVVRDLESDTFSFANFYERRVRRIVPALAATVLGTLIGGWVLLWPSQLENLGASAIFAALGVSNFYFLSNTGYFDQPASELPLLHTWSLGVEEQFYLFWPIALLLLSRIVPRFNWATAITLGLLIIISFGWSALTAFGDSQQAFFLPHLRAWELAAGAALVFTPRIKAAIAANVARLAGMLLIAYGAMFLSAEDVFPGANALFPVIGAVLVIWPSDKETLIGRLLSISPAVLIGKISYSLYLVHWPAIVLSQQYKFGGNLSRFEKILLLLVCLALAYLMWRFIEQPFRKRLPSRNLLFRPAGALAALALAVTIGIATFATSGFPSRLSPDQVTAISYLNYEKPDIPAQVCDLRDSTGTMAIPDCIDNPDDRPHVLVLGDSHAAHFVAALTEVFPEFKISNMSFSKCRPVLNPLGNETCVRNNKKAFETIIPTGAFDYVLISARWRNGESEQVGETAAFVESLGVSAVVFGQTIEYGGKVPELVMASVLPRQNRPSIEDAIRLDAMRKVNETVYPLAIAAGADFFNPLEAICDQDVCETHTSNGAPFQRDYGHLTLEGAVEILDRFKTAGLFSSFQAQ